MGKAWLDYERVIEWALPLQSLGWSCVGMRTKFEKKRKRKLQDCKERLLAGLAAGKSEE
jgi:hypothetical protein